MYRGAGYKDRQVVVYKDQHVAGYKGFVSVLITSPPVLQNITTAILPQL